MGREATLLLIICVDNIIYLCTIFLDLESSLYFSSYIFRGFVPPLSGNLLIKTESRNRTSRSFIPELITVSTCRGISNKDILEAK